jgi:hypothetical protein
MRGDSESFPAIAAVPPTCVNPVARRRGILTQFVLRK